MPGDSPEIESLIYKFYIPGNLMKHSKRKYLANVKARDLEDKVCPMPLKHTSLQNRAMSEVFDQGVGPAFITIRAVQPRIIG